MCTAPFLIPTSSYSNIRLYDSQIVLIVGLNLTLLTHFGNLLKSVKYALFMVNAMQMYITDIHCNTHNTMQYSKLDNTISCVWQQILQRIIEVHTLLYKNSITRNITY